MRRIATAFFLTLGLVSGFGVQSASAESLASMKSACLTGDYTACSRYNSAIISRNSAQRPVLTQGYDPFRILPATKAERTPTRPAGTPGINAAGKSGLTTVDVVTVQ